MLKELIIKVSNQEIYLSPKLIIPIQQTNIPIDHCKFRSHDNIFWKVELIDYNPHTKCWRMKVIDYSTKDRDNFRHQKSTKEVERIAFEKFDWLKFETLLMRYQKSKLLDVLENHDTERFFREQSAQILAPRFSIADLPEKILETNLPYLPEITTPLLPTERKPIIKTHKVNLSINISDTHFMLGYVCFSKVVKEVGERVEFKINNDFILAEFDSIKPWFARILKTKKFNVYATITTTNGNVTEVFATSSQIDQINAGLIDSVKYQRTIALTKSPKVSETNKSLFTSEDIFGEMETDDKEGNVFNQNEADILGYILDKFKTRNRKHLEYLSGAKQAVKNKLRFTLHPNFGFLFFIEGKENNHFVWELLNSHATYIWSIDKSDQATELQYKRIEASINTIRDTGREQYKRAYRENHIDQDLAFCIIEHDKITSNFVDGFVKWKHKLNEKIT